MTKRIILILLAMFLTLSQVAFAYELPNAESMLENGLPTSTMLKKIIDKQLNLRQYQDNVSYAKFKIIDGPQKLESVWVLDTVIESSNLPEIFNIDDSMIFDEKVNLYRVITELSDYYFKDGAYGKYGYVIFAQSKKKPTDIDVIEYCMSYTGINLTNNLDQNQLYYSFPSQLYKVENNQPIPIDIVTEETTLAITPPLDTDFDSYFSEEFESETRIEDYKSSSKYTSELKNYPKIFKFEVTDSSLDSYMSNADIINGYSNRISNLGITNLDYSNLKISKEQKSKYIFGGNQWDFRNFDFATYGCGYIAMSNAYLYLNEAFNGDFFEVNKLSNGLIGTNSYMKKIDLGLAQKIISIKNSKNTVIGKEEIILSKSPSEVLVDSDPVTQVAFTIPIFTEAIESNAMIGEDSFYGWQSDYRVLSNIYIPRPNETTSIGSRLFENEKHSNHNNSEYNLSEVVRFVTESFREKRPVMIISLTKNPKSEDPKLFNSFNGHVVTAVRIYRVDSTMPHFIVTANRGNEIGYNLDILANAYGITESNSIFTTVNPRVFLSIGVKNMGVK